MSESPLPSCEYIIPSYEEIHRHLDESRVQRVQSILSQYPRAQNSYSTTKDPEVVGFPTSAVVKLVQLHGEEHTIEFWRQSAARLAASGHRLEGSSELPASDRAVSVGRLTRSSPEAIVVDRKLGWSAENEEATGRKLVKDQNDLGLYENCNAPGIRLSVEVEE
ncbi:hypothetical protein BDV29DRAFT_201361 [Aspergillus leporis]|uniref:Uncharacterized protein n=1 Tax=Aspergillus leporis TaxID=41062 RepID=A0A5N5X1D9_9EURO|nr:hypothetical protein BDV29DRAFT_201361 [Aspergillus leporis]